MNGAKSNLHEMLVRVFAILDQGLAAIPRLTLSRLHHAFGR